MRCSRCDLIITSLCSASYTSCQRGTARALAAERRAATPCCCRAPGGRRCRSISSAHTALSSKPAARRSCGPMMRQTDGRTLDRFIDPAPHTMRAVSSSPVGAEISSQNNDVVSSILSPFLAEQSGIRQSSLPRNPRLQNPQLLYHQTNLRANLDDEYSTLHSPSGCSTVSSSPVGAQQSGIQ